jgi:hypothetical protein
MNNTTTKKTRTTLTAIVAIFMAATLVVGTLATTTTLTQTALAYSQKKKDNAKGNDNGNTITIQKCKQAATQSGFDNNQEQECENLICTHPGENATCVQEGVAAAQQGNQTTPGKLTCEQCFTKFLSSTQLDQLLGRFTLEQICAILSRGTITLEGFENTLTILEQLTGQPIDQAGLIRCLQNAGIVFSTRGG